MPIITITADHNFTYTDNVAWVKGRHTVKFGMSLIN